MAIKHTEDFKLEAVRIALSSGLQRVDCRDLGVGKRALSKWISVCRPSDMPIAPQADLAKKNERVRVTPFGHHLRPITACFERIGRY
jgi:transposase